MKTYSKYLIVTTLVCSILLNSMVALAEKKPAGHRGGGRREFSTPLILKLWALSRK